MAIMMVIIAVAGALDSIATGPSEAQGEQDDARDAHDGHCGLCGELVTFEACTVCGDCGVGVCSACMEPDQACCTDCAAPPPEAVAVNATERVAAAARGAVVEIPMPALDA